MSLKGWVVNRVNQLFTRVDLPPRATPLGQAVMRRAGAARLRAPPRSHDTLSRPQHLGAYAPLVAAMREELEHFVASHVRMHLAIAEHDRYLLTSIDVECVAGDESRELLQRFIREFKPEQIKHYLAKEVIGRLPNASALDLAHFGGLNAAPDSDNAEAEAYGELLKELRRMEPSPGQRPYQVSLKGRWSELDRKPADTKDSARGFDVPAHTTRRPHARSGNRRCQWQPPRHAAVGDRRAVAMRWAMARAATSSSTASTRVAGIAKYG